MTGCFLASLPGKLSLVIEHRFKQICKNNVVRGNRLICPKYQLCKNHQNEEIRIEFPAKYSS